jgi:cytochrome c551/c552
MPIIVVTNELPRTMRHSVAETIVSSLSGAEGDWKVSLTSDTANHAWDVEVSGPDRFHWARRFSGDDRDGSVIAEAIRFSVEESGREMEMPMSADLSDALSSLAIQGVAFTEADPGQDGERKYVVDRVQLRESELIYLHKQGGLSVSGIRRYLLTRNAA